MDRDPRAGTELTVNVSHPRAGTAAGSIVLGRQ